MTNWRVRLKRNTILASAEAHIFMELWQKWKNEGKTDPEQLLIDYKEVFNTEVGKRVLHDLDRKTTFSRPSITRTKAIDPYLVVYDEAQRSMFLYIIKQIHKTPKTKERKVDNG